MAFTLPELPFERDALGPIRQPAEDERTSGKGVAEHRLDIAVLRLRQAELPADAHRGVGQRLPVHVVDDRGGEQEAADPPPHVSLTRQQANLTRFGYDR